MKYETLNEKGKTIQDYKNAIKSIEKAKEYYLLKIKELEG